jgi:uncharacterized protein YcbX
MKSTGRVTAINRYPIKSCAGINLDTAQIVERGIAYDREWVLINEAGKSITQREFAEMALIQTTLMPNGALELNAPQMAPLVVPANSSDRSQCSANVWGTECAADDEGDEAAQWFCQYLKTKCRLVRVSKSNTRTAKGKLPNAEPVKITFVDGNPLLVVSQESLDDLNGKMNEPVPMNRFRPNIVIEGLGAFAEDRCSSLQLGPLKLFKAAPCSRCVITTIDQQTLKKGAEPLRTLSTYRMDNNKVLFGSYFLHGGTGRISLGDEVIADPF